MSAITINPCPFCAYTDVEIDEIDLNCYAVCCPDCEAIGPVSKANVEEAIAKWNARPREGLPAGIEEALNSGDGTYRP